MKITADAVLSDNIVSHRYSHVQESLTVVIGRDNTQMNLRLCNVGFRCPEDQNAFICKYKRRLCLTS